jgi:electron transport complex protein RnfG
MVFVMGIVGLVASFLLVATFVVTTPYIEANLAAYLEQAIGEVLPGMATKATWIADENGLRPETNPSEPGDRIYVGYDANGTFLGVAVPAQGQGYADVIRIIYGYNPDCSCIVGMKVLESRETPGLGDRIEKDPDFRANFQSLSVRWSRSAGAIEGLIELIKRGPRSNDWEIHGISGATISSRAITDILNAANGRLVPLIEENVERFTTTSQ